MADTRRISVKLAGKEFAMTIPKNDEEKYRRAAQEVNELISAYKGSFVAETEDYLAMAALQVAVDKVSMRMDRTLADEKASLQEINDQLNSYLNKIK